MIMTFWVIVTMCMKWWMGAWARCAKIPAMPKISASTVAEHHEIQHQQVLDVALALIESSRGAVPAVGEVAKMVGLARSSVYQYISSKQDLVAQLLTRFLKQWAEEVAAAMDAAGSDPRARLDAILNQTWSFSPSGKVMR